jgi:hypothetical protein
LAYVISNGFHATSAVANSAVSASYHARASRCTSSRVIAAVTGATKNTASVPPAAPNSAISNGSPRGNVGTIPAPSGDGVQPSGDAIARRFGNDSHSAIGAASINNPFAIN